MGQCDMNTLFWVSMEMGEDQCVIPHLRMLFDERAKDAQILLAFTPVFSGVPHISRFDAKFQIGVSNAHRALP